MPLFLCRWLNGDCSVVWAPHKDDAIVELDQVANAEACPIAQVRAFQVHFVLNEQGKLSLEALGEGTEEEIISWAIRSPLGFKSRQKSSASAGRAPFGDHPGANP